MSESVSACHHPPPTTEPTRTRTFPIKWLIVGAVVVVLLVIAGWLAGRRPIVLDSTTPEGAVQAYLQAVVDRDIGTARTWLSPDLAERCTEEDFGLFGVAEDVRITIGEVISSSERRIVSVDIDETHGSPPFDSHYTHEERFVLGPRGTGWAIVEDPWPFYYCPEES